MEAKEAGTGSASAGADRAWGIFWVLLGGAIAYGALRIDRLEQQGVEWFAAPGLLPLVLGVVIALNGLLILGRGLRGKAPAPAEGEEGEAPHSALRIGLTLLLCLGFAVGLVGHGLPFGVCAGLYLFLHLTLLEWDERKAAGTLRRGLARAAIVALAVALAVPYVFEHLFLVRLP